MLVLLSAPRGRVSAARLAAAHREDVEEAYGIVIRPGRTEPAPVAARAQPAVPATGGEA